jgi:hypothetical protein
MSRSRLLSGRVPKRTGPDLDAARYEFLDLANAEPDLGQPNFDGAVLISDADGSRYWTDNIRIDLTGNIYVGTISNSDGSSAIRMLDNVLVEDNLTVQGILTAPSMSVSTINTADSSPLTVATGLNVEGDLTVSDFTVKGNLTVQGTTTTINSTTLTVADKNIELASGATTAESADGAGITVLGPTVPANIIYDGQQDRWKFNKNLETPGTIFADKVVVYDSIVGNFEDVITEPQAIDIFQQLIIEGIDSTDSSPINFIPAVIMQSDLTVENDLIVRNTVTASRIVGYLDGSARDIDNTAITNKEFATELDANLDQVFVYDVSEGQLKKTYLSEIVNQGSNGFAGSQGDPGFAGSQGDPGFAGSQGDPGFAGSQGELGYTGSAGFTGSFGFTGSQGERGYVGSAGVDGFTGSRGDDGTSVKIVGLVATANDLPDPYNGNVGDGYIVTDTGNLWTWSGSAWVEVGRILGYTGSQGPAGGYTGSKGDPGVAASFTTRAYTGDGSTTVFGITEGNTVQTVMVFLNGVNQRPTDDYTIAGSTLTFATAPSAGELIIIREMPQAATGYTGSIGVAGFTGSQGIPGEAAAIGYTGSAGFTGSEGYTGSQGTSGTSVKIIGSVATANDLPLDGTSDGSTLLVPGDGFIVQSTGELYIWDGNQWINVGRIVGYTGSQGLRGFTGSAGAGSQGSSGGSYVSMAMTGLITTPYIGTVRFYPPKNINMYAVYASVSQAATSGAFTFIIKKNGVSIGTTFTIAQNQNTMTTTVINASVLTTDYLTLDVTGASATDLFVKIEYINN